MIEVHSRIIIHFIQSSKNTGLELKNLISGFNQIIYIPGQNFQLVKVTRNVLHEIKTNAYVSIDHDANLYVNLIVFRKSQKVLALNVDPQK